MANEWVTWAYEQDLPPTTKFVLVVMGDRADHEGYCWPSRKDISQKTGLSERSVTRATAELEEKGFIKVEARRRKDGYKTSNGYYLQRTRPGYNLSLDIENDLSSDTESPDNLSPDTESRDNNVNSQGTESPDKEYNNKLLYSNHHLNPHTGARAREEGGIKKSGFAEWYKLYPHKIGEAKAREEYRHAIGKVDFDTLMTALKRYIAEKPPDQKYCNPATWLREERWKDQPAPKNPTKTTGETNDTAKSNEFRNRTDAAFGSAFDELFGSENAGRDGNHAAETASGMH